MEEVQNICSPHFDPDPVLALFFTDPALNLEKDLDIVNSLVWPSIEPPSHPSVLQLGLYRIPNCPVKNRALVPGNSTLILE